MKRGAFIKKASLFYFKTLQKPLQNVKRFSCKYSEKELEC